MWYNTLFCFFRFRIWNSFFLRLIILIIWVWSFLYLNFWIIIFILGIYYIICLLLARFLFLSLSTFWPQNSRNILWSTLLSSIFFLRCCFSRFTTSFFLSWSLSILNFRIWLWIYWLLRISWLAKCLIPLLL